MHTGRVLRGQVLANYDLCWSPDSSLADRYLLRIGAFELHGPDTSVAYGCTLGLSCLLQITGRGLNEGNNPRVWVRSDGPEFVEKLWSCEGSSASGSGVQRAALTDEQPKTQSS